MSSKDTEKVEKEDIVWLNDIKKSREIVTEILRFGVNQSQMKEIINLLALELEDRNLMISIREVIESKESSDSENNHIQILHPGG